MITIGSGMPFVFKQERIGLNKTPFVIYKFRTMKNGKITILGKILRKTGIDELFQLINIVIGTMNFVGPRPLTKADIERLKWNDKSFRARWDVKPGITGLAQLTNVCDARVSWERDKYYVANRSPRLDRKILCQSVLIPFLGKTKVKGIIHNSNA
jgi:lipopolysaccharide/colanic/teichoic acid biosynthesis glycosyltransferase